MKYILVILCITLGLLLTHNSIGQIQQIRHNKFLKVGKINRTGGEVPNVALEISVDQKTDPSNFSNDTMYVIRFQDGSIKSPIFANSEPLLETIYFKGTNNSIGQLYELLKNVFSDKRYEDMNYETTLILGSRIVVIRRDFYADKTKVQVIAGGVMFAIRNMKELDGLFGK